MNLEIKCPSCGNQTTSAWEKVPKGRLKTTCNKCSHQFPLEKETSLNCKALRPQEGPVYADDGWRVEHPACEGMKYDLEGVEGLIRSGMVGPDSRVSPPGQRGYMPIAEVPQLKKAVDQWEAKNKGGRG